MDAVQVFKALSTVGKYTAAANFMVHPRTRNMEKNLHAAKRQGVFFEFEFDRIHDGKTESITGEEKRMRLNEILKNPNLIRLSGKEFTAEIAHFLIEKEEDFNLSEMDSIYFQRFGNPIFCLGNKRKLDERAKLKEAIMSNEKMSDREKEREWELNDTGVSIFIDVTDARTTVFNYARGLDKIGVAAQSDTWNAISTYGIPIVISAFALSTVFDWINPNRRK